MSHYTKIAALAISLLALLLLAGCGNGLKNMYREGMEKYNIVRFNFASIGAIETRAIKVLVIDQHDQSEFDFAKLLGTVVQERMKARNFDVGPFIASNGGMSSFEEMTLEKRTFQIRFNWVDNGIIYTTVSAKNPEGAFRYLTITDVKLKNLKGFYTSGESFYEGLKQELEAPVDQLLDMIFKFYYSIGNSSL